MHAYFQNLVKNMMMGHFMLNEISGSQLNSMRLLQLMLYTYISLVYQISYESRFGEDLSASVQISNHPLQGQLFHDCF